MADCGFNERLDRLMGILRAPRIDHASVRFRVFALGVVAISLAGGAADDGDCLWMFAKMVSRVASSFVACNWWF